MYAQGEDAVIELVESLVARINALEARVEALENQISKDSRTSSKPPSSDGFGKRTKSLRKASERPSGGQLDHPGNTLEWREQVDERVLHSVSHCSGCGVNLSEVAAFDVIGRQVHDLPELSLVVREHQVESKCCPGCGRLNQGAFPPEVTSRVQYGPNLKALMVYLMEGQFLPTARVCELLSEVLGCEVSEGTLYHTRLGCFEALDGVETQIKQGIQTSEVVHFDETGFRVKGKLMWLHVACSPELTTYFVHEKRGQVAMDAMDILPTYSGMSVHDGLRSYALYGSLHGLCNAHHLRELEFLEERYDQGWAGDMQTLLLNMKHQVETAKQAGRLELTPTQRDALTRHYESILAAGLKENPPPPVNPNGPKQRGRVKQSPAKNLLDRLKKHQSAVLAFMNDFRVPFDNNQAERDLRMMKLKQKISGTFRSMEGAQQFCRIRGYLSTLRKQGIPVLEALKQIFMKTPIIPAI